MEKGRGDPQTVPGAPDKTSYQDAGSATPGRRLRMNQSRPEAEKTMRTSRLERRSRIHPSSTKPKLHQAAHNLDHYHHPKYDEINHLTDDRLQALFRLSA